MFDRQFMASLAGMIAAAGLVLLIASALGLHLGY